MSRSVDVMTIDRPGDLGDIADLGLTLAQGKQLVALVQQEIVAAQSRDHAARRPMCRSCGAACQVALRLPRFRCAGCGGAEAGHGWRIAARRPNLTKCGRTFPCCVRSACGAATSWSK